jgi:hypothetical protein
MKELLALLFIICFGVATFYFSIIRRLDRITTVSFLIFSLAGGISIANYDIIKKLKWENKLGNVEIETFERRVTEVKEQAVEEIRQEAEQQRRRLILAQLRQLYILSHDGLSAEILSGVAPLPKDWVEQKLKERGETWRQDQYY